MTNLPYQLLNQTYQWEMISAGSCNQIVWELKNMEKAQRIENMPLRMTFQSQNDFSDRPSKF